MFRMSFAQIGKDERRVDVGFAERLAGRRRTWAGHRSGRAGKEFVGEGDSPRRSGFEDAAEKSAFSGGNCAFGRMGEARRARSARAAQERRARMVVVAGDSKPEDFGKEKSN